MSPVAPSVTGHAYHLLGATFQAKEILDQQIELDRAQLVSEAKSKWPEFVKLTLEDVVSEKVGYRASTPDKLPLVGPVFDTAFATGNYHAALKGESAASFTNLPPLAVNRGEWVCLGMGSRGVPFSSLSAEILASLMTGMPLPIETELFHHLHPIRFLIRNLKKTKLN